MVEYIQDFNRNIIKNLHKSIKLCQTEFINKGEVATESNKLVALMCKEWENVFLHGIKRRLNKGFFSLKSSNIAEMPTSIYNQINPFSSQTNSTFWLFLCEFLAAEDIIRFSQSLSKIDSEIGRCRAWLRAAINEQTLEFFLIKILSQQGQATVKLYYDCYAVLLDLEENTVLPSMAAGLGSIWFALELNSDHLNNNSDISRRFSLDSRSQNNSDSSSSFYRPLLFSSSNSGSFEEVEIKETPQKNQENDSSQGSKSKGRNRVISIAPIEDDDDSKSDSSDLYSPFNLLKSGLNLVSKFHFGNDDRLSEIKEQESQNNNNEVSICGLTDVTKTHVIDGSLRECDETDFHNCCLSLQNDFYSPDDDNSLCVSNLNGSVTNVTYKSVDLVVDSSGTSSSLQKSPETYEDKVSLSGLTFLQHQDSNNVIHLEETRNLRQQLEAAINENILLKNEMEYLKCDFRKREEEFKCESIKILRENDLLKKRLKEYLFKNDNENESENHATKMEQLIQMHADLIELNDQLQRSLVDKDIKLGMLQSKVAKLMYDEEEVGVHIEHFGTIYLRITDYLICGEGSQKHLSYKISISCWPISEILMKQNSEWFTYRRFKEFHRFYVDILNKYPVLKNVSFPSKWVYKPSNDQLSERQRGLEFFLRTVVTFVLQQWVKNNHNHTLSDVDYNHTGTSSPISLDTDQLQSNQIESKNISNSSFKKEAKDIILNIIPFLASNLGE